MLTINKGTAQLGLRTKEPSAQCTRFREPSPKKTLAGQGTRIRTHDTTCRQDRRRTHRANDRQHHEKPQGGSEGRQNL
ncbi:MAG: hypothetical protein UT30_C0020G0002 [Candidatus Uhrbacteria bacterium GW2011_GWF2_39_13]|uniref:Uncharacterized protein n=1 Tax=Candidatus Uhrbacteria bacterium GW2011_GWF2_39_13 TaxID=1618995 RepID=A0A0G0MKR9_9BACT|nr:MAG: hypothetical protein UT30_C0020G0002 [Candidatus Uhrbacteria bacterium GW2011_GWF2_39_13]